MFGQHMRITGAGEQEPRATEQKTAVTAAIQLLQLLLQCTRTIRNNDGHLGGARGAAAPNTLEDNGLLF